MGEYMRNSLLPWLAKSPRVDVVAACDVWPRRYALCTDYLTEKVKLDGLPAWRETAEAEEIFADSTIDAVVIATPDHWHVPMCLAALRHTRWCLEHGNRPIAWQADLGRPQLVTGYTFTSANDVPDRDPGSWEFEGSDDGTAWETIDEHTNVVPMPKRHATARYALDKPVTHRHVRFVFHPRPDVSHLQVAEIGLDGIALGGDAPAPAGKRLHTAEAEGTGRL